VSSRRACVYPNVGFQLQLCLYEKQQRQKKTLGPSTLGPSSKPSSEPSSEPSPSPSEEEDESFEIAKEIAHSIDRTLDNVKERLDRVFDEDPDDASRWLDYGFFFQNCREYLGHVDIGLPPALLTKADDTARKLRNLDAVFSGAGIAVAVRVGKVLDVWQSLQTRMANSVGALPYVFPFLRDSTRRRLDMRDFVSAIDDNASSGKATTTTTRPLATTTKDDELPANKRQRRDDA